jgi:hypothetical protein
MSKFVIYLSGRPQISGHRRGEFNWSEEHKCFLYHNEVFDESRMNELVPKAFARYRDDNPLVKCVEVSAPAADLSSALESLKAEIAAFVAENSNIKAAAEAAQKQNEAVVEDLRSRLAAAPSEDLDGPAPREITVEEAEAVLQRLAPDRLKKKTGPKPAGSTG